MPNELQEVPLAWLKPNPRNARTHSRKQIRAIARSIDKLGFQAPIVADENGLVLAGHGRLEAAKSLDLGTVPVVIARGLSEAKKRALMLADNKIAEAAGWDRARLEIELQELTVALPDEGLEIVDTGFTVGEIDQLHADLTDKPDPADAVPTLEGPTVTRRGDLWLLGEHRLLCGDARDKTDLARLMGGASAAMAITDPPFNVPVAGIVGRGRIRHAEFAMASGEMSREAFTAFLTEGLTGIAAVLRDGALAYVFMDWRHVGELVAAGEASFDTMVNLCVWAKTNAGQGSFYRSQHELVGVFRKGREPHLNNVELGRHGRNRSNVWTHQGVNSFGKHRLADLASHPTVKPVAMIADAIKDCTKRRDVILDPFCGSGTTILAAEKVGRIGFGVEIEPRFVDVAIRRWEAFTGRDAIHADSGLTFEEERETRAQSPRRATETGDKAA